MDCTQKDEVEPAPLHLSNTIHGNSTMNSRAHVQPYRRSLQVLIWLWYMKDRASTFEATPSSQDLRL